MPLARSAAAKSFSSLEPVRHGMKQSREAVIRIHFHLGGERRLVIPSAVEVSNF